MEKSLTGEGEKNDGNRQKLNKSRIFLDNKVIVCRMLVPATHTVVLYILYVYMHRLIRLKP